MSTSAIDTARTSERLSAFLSEITTNDPIDNYFPRVPAIKQLLDKKETINGGRQLQTPIDSGANSTIADFSDYDEFDGTAQNTALTLVYPMVNKGGTVVISWEEMREIAGNDHRIFDLVKHKRDNVVKSALDALDTDLFAATQNAQKITALPIAVLATGALGGLNQSTDSDWAAAVTASGSFASQGLNDMRTLWRTVSDNGSDPDSIIVHPDVYGYYETEIDPDVRYSIAQSSAKSVGSRGFGGGLEFNGVMLTRDKKCNSGVLYMLNSESIKMYVDTEGNFDLDEFVIPPLQKAFVSKFVFRGQISVNRRKSLGKLTGLTA